MPVAKRASGGDSRPAEPGTKQPIKLVTSTKSADSPRLSTERPSLRQREWWWLWWGMLPVTLLLPAALILQKGKDLPDAFRYGAANGVFPEGCKWRDVQRKGAPMKFWAVEEYEFWDERQQDWTRRKPADCLIKGHANPRSWPWRDGSPRTQVECDDTHCLYQHLWHSNGRWYLLVGDGNPPVDWWQMTRNQNLQIVHVNNASSFAEAVDYRVIRGDTLVFDFVFFLHPTAIGHWGEMMFPLYSILRNEEDFAKPPDQFLLLHLKRVHLMEWARAVMAATLGLQPGQQLPPIIMQQEQSDVWNQIQQPLEGTRENEWLCFERALVVRDTFTGGLRSFFNRDDAQAFRAAIYRNHGLAPPKYRVPPRIITFQRKRANRRVINEERLIKLLQTYGEVRVVEFDSSTPFKEQLETIAATGLFVSVHTSNLANAQFLQPGSAVFEIIQRNWLWADMDRSFKVQTERMGDIHHFAWRAQFRNQTVYINKRDGERFGNWPPQWCTTEDCVEAHTNVDVVVNLEEIKRILDAQLPLVFNGTSVEDAEMPWPEALLDPDADFDEGLSPAANASGEDL